MKFATAAIDFITNRPPKKQQSRIIMEDENATGTAKPFTVCTDVELGPLLPPVKEPISRQWARIAKNESSSNPNKTQKMNRYSYLREKYAASSQNGVCESKASSFVEACSMLDSKRLETSVPVFQGFDSINLLAQAVHTSFYKHYPLRLSPDVIWLTILQGLAKHVDKNPEGQRKNFVNFEGGKQTLVVCRPEFQKGSPDNDWTTVFPQFAEMMESYIGQEKAAAMTCDFSTSTPTDRICSHVALMDTVKHYFEYEMLYGCGIPSIELTGNVEDWVALRKKAEFLTQFHDLEWWTTELFPVLDQFVAAAKGSPDIKFWKSVCNLYGASGLWSEYVTGWIQVFFPYTTDGSRFRGLSQWRKNYEKGTGRETEDYNRGVRPKRSSWNSSSSGPENMAGFGLKLDRIPVGVSQAPFGYTDMATGRKFDMTFNGGIVAILQDTKSKALEPVTGWAVLDHGEILGSMTALD